MPSTREARTLLALGTLERWIGRPVFDAIMLAFVHDLIRRAPDARGLPARRERDVSGQDLSWLFEQTFEGSGVFDYASRQRRERAADRTAGIERRSPYVAWATGRSPSGANAAVAAVRARPRHHRADDVRRRRQHSRQLGRAQPREDVRVSQPVARGVSAEVDPDRVLLLDLNRSNNGVTLERGRAARRPHAGRHAGCSGWKTRCSPTCR